MTKSITLVLDAVELSTLRCALGEFECIDDEEFEAIKSIKDKIFTELEMG